MIKVLFVCHGNICRSPMAEFIFKDMIKRNDAEDLFYVESAGTSSEEIIGGVGNPLYFMAKSVLKDNHVPYGEHHARQMTKDDYDRFDKIIAMENMNVWNIRRITDGDKDGKIKLLLDYTDLPGDVPDPWYTGKFDKTYKEIVRGCEGILKFYTDIKRVR